MKNIKVMGNQAAQGDVLFTRVDSIPSNAVKQEAEENGDHIITHSETGHHHVMASKGIDFYEAANDPFMMYLVVKEPTNLRHLRDTDTHETIQFLPGKYRVNRQREMSGEMIMPAID